MVTALYIDGTKIDLAEEVPYSLNFSIADIREPQNRQNSFSKTISVPATKVNNAVFTSKFEINIDGGYNPNVKKDAELYVNDILQFKGYVQLKNIRTTNYRKTHYDVVLVGEMMDLYGQIGTGELTDLDYSDLNHSLTLTNIANSWTATQGEGYYYPMIDYGNTSNRQAWEVTQLYPAIYVKEYLDKIFSNAGFSYSSDFLTGDFFKSLIIPFNKNRLELSASQVLAREFLASRRTTDQTVDSSVTNFGGVAVDLTFNDDSTSPNFDTSGVYNTSTGVYTVSANGYYNISALVYYAADFAVTSPTGGRTYLPAQRIVLQTRLLQNGGATNTIVGNVLAIWQDTAFASTSSTADSPTYPDSDYQPSAFSPTAARQVNPPNACQVEFVNVSLSAGDTIKIDCLYKLKDTGQAAVQTTPKFIDQTDSTLKDGTYTLRMLQGSRFRAQVANTAIMPNGTIDMNQAVPEQIKQADLLTSIIRMFNLYVQQTGPKEYTIEPRDDFYLPALQANKVDWTYKLDNNSEMEIMPVGALDAGEYYFSYKPDSDYLNVDYEQKWGEIYGERLKRIDTDFFKDRKATEVIFSPSVLSDMDTGDMPITTMYKADNNGAVIPYGGNIRILQAGGLKDCTNVWTLTDLSTTNSYTQYPYAGHLDDPYTPTIDINWGVVRQVYYRNTYNDIVWTDNNLYNQYYSKFISEISDENSAIVTAWFWLNPEDIEALSFRKLYYFKDAFFRLHRVFDYSPTRSGITKCEFLKIKDGVAFQSLQTDIDGAYNGNDTFTEPKLPPGPSQDGNNAGDYVNYRSVTVSGEDNYVARSANWIEILGDSNIVGEDCERIYINGTSNTIYGDVTDVSLIRSSGMTITESGVTAIANQVVSGEGSVYRADSDYSISILSIPLAVLCDTDTKGSSLTVTLPNITGLVALQGVSIEIKRLGAYTVTIDTAGSQTIDGDASIDLKVENDSVTIMIGDDLNYYIV